MQKLAVADGTGLRRPDGVDREAVRKVRAAAVQLAGQLEESQTEGYDLSLQARPPTDLEEPFQAASLAGPISQGVKLPSTNLRPFQSISLSKSATQGGNMPRTNFGPLDSVSSAGSHPQGEEISQTNSRPIQPVSLLGAPQPQRLNPAGVPTTTAPALLAPTDTQAAVHDVRPTVVPLDRSASATDLDVDLEDAMALVDDDSQASVLDDAYALARQDAQASALDGARPSAELRDSPSRGGLPAGDPAGAGAPPDVASMPGEEAGSVGRDGGTSGQAQKAWLEVPLGTEELMEVVAVLVAAAYPDRIALRRDRGNRWEPCLCI